MATRTSRSGKAIHICAILRHDLVDLITSQQKNRGLPGTGFVVAKPTCSIQSYLVAIHALREAGYPIKDILVNTLQALSGAGYKGLTEQDRLVILIGKDGGVKRRAGLNTDLSEIFLQIDGMPMRQQEMRAKQKAGIEITPP